jgi:hypothetical protein
MAAHLEKEFPAKGSKVTLFSLVLPAFLILTFSLSVNALELSAPNPAFEIATVDKMAEEAVHWVAAGGGMMAYGAMQHVWPLRSPLPAAENHLT